MVLIFPWMSMVLIILCKRVHMLPNTTAEDVTVKDLSSCEEGWKRYDQYCFKHVTRYLTWSRASSECKNMGGHLASIHSEEQNDFVDNLTVKNVGISCWIGLISHDWRDIFAWDDGTAVDYTNWGPNEPTYISGERCAEFSILNVAHFTSGNWLATTCNTPFTFLCQKMIGISTMPSTATDTESIDLPPTTIVYDVPKEIYSCEEGWKRYDQYCYKLVNNGYGNHLRWRDASIKCNSMGGQLASVHSKEQNDFLEDICGRSNSIIGCWIGLYEHAVESKFAWSDETDVDYTDWKQNEPKGQHPDGKCVGLIYSKGSSSFSGTWLVYRCIFTRPVLCQKKISTSTIASTDINRKTTTSPNTSMELDDTTITTSTITRSYIERETITTTTITRRNMERENNTSLHASMEKTYGRGFISLKSHVTTIILIIVFMTLLGGILYFKRHWLKEKRSRLTAVFFRRDDRITDQSTEIIWEPNSTI